MPEIDFHYDTEAKKVMVDFKFDALYRKVFIDSLLNWVREKLTGSLYCSVCQPYIESAVADIHEIA